MNKLDEIEAAQPLRRLRRRDARAGRQFQFEAMSRELARHRRWRRIHERSRRPGRSNSDVVLIVDDVRTILRVARALDESGYTVLVATGGEAALQRAAQALPDIVLLDAMMPAWTASSGQTPQGLAQTAHIPIIFMTGLTETEHLVAALAAGGVDYVTKPIKPRNYWPAWA